MRKFTMAALFLAFVSFFLVCNALAAPPLVSFFNLSPNPKFGPCAQKSSMVPLAAAVNLAEGPLNDTLTLRLSNFKPNLGFDLFTIQNTNLNPDGTLNPNFTNFGLA